MSPAGAALFPHPPVLAAASVALVAAAWSVDVSTREELFTERDPGLVPLQKWANRLGNGELGLPALGAIYAIGRWGGHPALETGAEQALAGLVAAGIVNGALKAGLGRARPYTGRNHDTFFPLTLNNRHQSFPSGHTTVAFSLATSLAMETHSVPVAVLAYGAAGLTGWARIYGDNHWASDVVAGAIIGTVFTRATIIWLRRRESSHTQAHAHVMVSPSGLAVSIPVR